MDRQAIPTYLILFQFDRSVRWLVSFYDYANISPVECHKKAEQEAEAGLKVWITVFAQNS